MIAEQRSPRPARRRPAKAIVGDAPADAAPSASWPQLLADFTGYAAGRPPVAQILERCTVTIKTALGVDCHIERRAARRLSRGNQNGLGSCESVVIEGDSWPFGTLVMNTSKGHALSSEAVEFAAAVARIVSEALLRNHYLRDRVRLKTIMSTAGDAIVGLTRSGRIFSWNEAAEALFGYCSADIVGHPVAEIFDSGKETLRRMEPLWAGSGSESFEAEFRHRDGSSVHTIVRFAPAIDADGRISAASMIASDTRERRRADSVIHMHADILAHLPSAVIVWRLADRTNASSLKLVLANPAAEQLAGRSLNHMTGATFADAAPECDDANPEPYAAVVRTKTRAELGVRRVARSDGSRSIYRVEAFPLPDQCVAVAYHDVTDYHTLAEQLQHAQRLQVVGRLAGGVAHDFNNVLTVISGHSELLRGALADQPTALEDIEEILHAADSARDLTQQLLAFSGRQLLRPANVGLGTVLAKTRKMLNRVIGEDIELALINQENVTVCADASQLEQVLLNLAINARDAMPAGGKLFLESSFAYITPRDSGRVDVPPGAYGVLQVTDSGIGMDRATLARIFEPFFTTKQPGKGSGLGLATVYGIVKQSGGYVTVQSEPGEGTTFKVYLPAIDATTEEHITRSQVPPPRGDGSKTILLVDDDESVRFLLQKVLANAGYTVLTAAGPEQALQTAGRFTGAIDLLLTDIVMPGQSGTELATRLSVRIRGLKVLYMSGYVAESYGHRAVPRDAELLQKPFPPGQLLDAIHRLLSPGGGPAGRQFEEVM